MKTCIHLHLNDFELFNYLLLSREAYQDKKHSVIQIHIFTFAGKILWDLMWFLYLQADFFRPIYMYKG